MFGYHLWMSHLQKFTIVSGVAGSSNALRRQGRQRSPNIAVEVEILEIKPLETNKLVRETILQYRGVVRRGFNALS